MPNHTDRTNKWEIPGSAHHLDEFREGTRHKAPPIEVLLALYLMESNRTGRHQSCHRFIYLLRSPREI